MVVVIPAKPERVYGAWLSGDEHAAMTGGAAECDPVVGGRYAAWDGYIHGVNVALEPYHRIVQTWRSSEFPTDAPDSQVELLLEEIDEDVHTRLTLRHTEIPDGQGRKYEDGWVESYFEPMKDYFGAQTIEPLPAISETDD